MARFCRAWHIYCEHEIIRVHILYTRWHISFSYLCTYIISRYEFIIILLYFFVVVVILDVVCAHPKHTTLCMCILQSASSYVSLCDVNIFLMRCIPMRCFSIFFLVVTYIMKINNARSNRYTWRVALAPLALLSTCLSATRAQQSNVNIIANAKFVDLVGIPSVTYYISVGERN